MNILSRYTFVSTYGKDQLTRQDVSKNGIRENVFSKCDTDNDGVVDIEDILKNQEMCQDVLKSIQSQIDKLTNEENIIKNETEKTLGNSVRKIVFDKDAIISEGFREFIEKEKRIGGPAKEVKKDDTPIEEDIISANEYQNFIDKEKHLGDRTIGIIADGIPTKEDIISANEYQNFIDKEKYLGDRAIGIIADGIPTKEDIISANEYQNFIDKEKHLGGNVQKEADVKPAKTESAKNDDVPVSFGHRRYRYPSSIKYKASRFRADI